MWTAGPDDGWTQANPGGRWAWEVWNRTLGGCRLWARTRQPKPGWKAIVYHSTAAATVKAEGLAGSLPEAQTLAERLARRLTSEPGQGRLF